jgi:hypothetical protein
MAWQPDPFLVSLLDSVEQDFASALEKRHRRGDGCHEDESPALRTESERIAMLQSAIDALQAALERRETAIVH